MDIYFYFSLNWILLILSRYKSLARWLNKTLAIYLMSIYWKNLINVHYKTGLPNDMWLLPLAKSWFSILECRNAADSGDLPQMILWPLTTPKQRNIRERQCRGRFAKWSIYRSSIIQGDLSKTFFFNDLNKHLRNWWMGNCVWK